MNPCYGVATTDAHAQYGMQELQAETRSGVGDIPSPQET